MRPVSGPVNRLLRRLCRWEEHVFPRNRCFGLTAFVLARRPDPPEATRTCRAARENEENAQR
jgi:hypothetical protein